MPTKETSRAIGGVSRRRGLVALWCFVAVGCAGVANAPTTGVITTAEPTAVATTPPAADAAAELEPPPLALVAALPDSTESSIEGPPAAPEPERAPPQVSPASLASESEVAVVAPAAPATEVLEPEPSVVPSLVASPTSVETLDFSSLVTRLRKTKAISLRTKVAVKNESDDLLEQARAYHSQTGETTLRELRRSYDSLFYKLHSLLEDADPPLARDIDRSRTAIWDLIADPRKFNAAHLMAGA